MVWTMTARSGRHEPWSILAMTCLVIASGIGVLRPTVAWAEGQPGGGGISSDKLWVNAQLGQPQGAAGGGGGPLTGRALRYIRLGAQTPCAPVAYRVPQGIAPWFGAGGDPNLNTEKVAVLSVNRQNPSDQVPLGFGCVNPGVLVRVPSVGEILSIFRSRYIPSPVVGLSPGERGLTGLQTWYWYPGNSDVSVGFDIRGFAITASAQATTYRWSTGDGAVLQSGRAGGPTAPSAYHTYGTKSSGYPVSLSMVWAGTYAWSGFGDSGGGPLGPVTVTGDIHPYPVAEVRSVLQ
jgi:hypothetical protein